ncbi:MULTISPECIES: 3'-5' exonuclease [Clostridium]|uniref:3'-5' exonuclease n=1 Tax=Clostridium aquiflavi TaxID=3073603 RepID=A0ABU1EGL2_9CLOT|nr:MULTISPECIES: 3'-5' exonuclease [unclassified Clostridium]MDR5587094.1 3'-5' exonuclease [Clostridium sp. 5N-1]
MNYIVYDLEFNQQQSKDANASKLTFEIIQIGALKLNNDLEITSTFNRLVKPTIHTEIHPYIENLTKITTAMVNLHNYFPDVYNDFVNFISDEEFTLCIWGTSDIKELMKNIKFHNLSSIDNFKKYIDVQKIASKYIKTPKGTRVGLRSAVEFFNIPIKEDFHDAFNDAYYTAEIFKKLYTPEIEASTYNNISTKRISKPKQDVNTKGLFAQFEKMYNKKMSEEEKSIIKLAYNMGRTNQFLK